MTELNIAAPENLPSVRHPVALITGTRGIGLEVASALHLKGFRTYVVGRDHQVGDAAVQRMRLERPDVPCGFLQADLGDLGSLQALAKRFDRDHERLDVLVNNAGRVTSRRSLTTSGWEMQMGVNYLGHFALTGLLLPLLRRSCSARVVSVASRGVSSARLDLADLQSTVRFNPMVAYSTSKMALLSFGLHLDAMSRAESWNLASYVAHPGICPTGIMDGAFTSPIMRRAVHNLYRIIGHPPAQAARSILRCALDPGLPTGSVIGPSGILEIRGEPAVSSVTRLAPSSAAASRLWALSQELTERPFPALSLPSVA
ncbi:MULTISPECIES: SDR family NAD(P)-dependent oxidoreductase [unclassified Sphingomonas]|uniref:SDR family NAD(P)-dependent oxidoreductase n=1 Tax=unclassified Sphingomonas TaxID=196159 RepID=UPI002269D1B2|nr:MULTISPECIES: SDR family NAD(P)-dependent oxidoreductase [unclassified Sphingomonas]